MLTCAHLPLTCTLCTCVSSVHSSASSGSSASAAAGVSPLLAGACAPGEAPLLCGHLDKKASTFPFSWGSRYA